MQPLFSTAGAHPRNSFQLWCDFLRAHSVPVEAKRRDDTPFEGRVETAEIGPLPLTRIAQGGVRNEVTPELLRCLQKDDTLKVVFSLAGSLAVQQDGRTADQRAGDLAVIDQRPNVLISGPNSQFLLLELPRRRLEGVFGPARLYTALTVGANVGAMALVKPFIHDLIRVRHQLTPDTAARMAAIGTDLIVASIAERLAQDVPQSLHGTVVVQRAKAYIEANLGDQTLDPPRLAAAMGLSLRRLQELFHAGGRHVSDYIWERRLEAAGKRLADPACAHLAIGTLAYSCGFASQAHFARRFKERYGATPRDYRQAALMGTP